MLEHTLATSVRTPRLTRRRPLAWMAGALLALAGLVLWQARGAAVADLGSVQHMHDHGVYSAWDNDEVIVLVRHAERCDRSRHACLDDPTGITVEGSRAAAAVGSGMRRLGLAGSDTLASPEVRTQQTASFLFGKAIETQDWLARCDDTFAEAALAHKRQGHNLVLVTHSGCIDHLERQLGVAGGDRDPGYASALFIRTDSNGKPRLLGQLNANQWRTLISQAGK
ncbi:histidine phosphatase family protein [Pseudomonas sp. NPDC089401]|uniref:lipopolysaccharide core heptose(II)-phosphate phosphatase PmrG n=1 Tax=Pseudomonas sp. NPDC089401 TaxID=3364462 RepID=UPI0038309839